MAARVGLPTHRGTRDWQPAPKARRRPCDRHRRPADPPRTATRTNDQPAVQSGDRSWQTETMGPDLRAHVGEPAHLSWVGARLEDKIVDPQAGALTTGQG